MSAIRHLGFKFTAVLAFLKLDSKSQPCPDRPRTGLFFTALRCGRAQGFGLCPVRRLICQSSEKSAGWAEKRKGPLITVVGAGCAGWLVLLLLSEYSKIFLSRIGPAVVWIFVGGVVGELNSEPSTAVVISLNKLSNLPSWLWPGWWDLTRCGGQTEIKSPPGPSLQTGSICLCGMLFTFLGIGNAGRKTRRKTGQKSAN